MAKQRESSVGKKITAYLDDLIKRGLPIYYEHRSGQGGYSYKKGVPDFFVVINGTHIEVETKYGDNERSTMQDKWKWRCEKQWLIPYCCPYTFEEFKEFIDPYIKKCL